MSSPAIKRWLLVSLVLNVFLVGGIAGGAWRWWTQGSGGTAASAQARGLRFAADDLSAEQRRAYLLGLRNARRESATSIQASRDGRQEVLRQIGEPQFDRAAVAGALARVRESDMAARVRVETSVVEFAASLSPADRQKLASGLERRSLLSPPVQGLPKP